MHCIAAGKVCNYWCAEVNVRFKVVFGKIAVMNERACR
jgi:hypothetical protein